MARANAAYYAAKNPFADFTTAPEITQVFGELLGAWTVVVWDRLGRPDKLILAEAGPGRGTLMADALRAVAQTAPNLRARVHLIETSPRLRALQAAAIPDASWHESVATLPDGPLVLLANEFLDALPIRQFVRRGAGWTERYVAGGRFVEHRADAPSGPPACAEGGIVEVCEPARAIAAWLGERLARDPGAALLLDYGPSESAAGDSLQAIRGAAPGDPLHDPGSADLTAHVDFAAFAAAARAAGAMIHGPIPQGVLLARLGLFQRTDRLARTLPPKQALAMIDGGRRLAEPARMGKLFKALAVCDPTLAIPPGFEPE